MNCSSGRIMRSFAMQLIVTQIRRASSRIIVHEDNDGKPTIA